MKNRIFERFKDYLSMEIMIEYKACLYFSCILFFYFVWLLCQGTYFASVLFMFEMILTAYFIGYLQVYVFQNFDEKERLGKKDAAAIIFCTALYGGASYLLNWFEKSIAASLLFSLFMLLVYMCVYLLNKAKRAIDTNNLNKLLTEYKNGGEK
ncbi:MAG: DUF3021 domain-containing protein [Clostridium sp.]|nr:DUF3021 domain-containing protein [Clostridium sp.]